MRAVRSGAVHVLQALRLVLPQVAPHLPAHPEQQEAPGEEQAHDAQQMHRDCREDYPQARGRGDSEHDRPVTLRCGEPGRSQADDDGVVGR